MANASSRHDTHSPIALWAAFLRIEGMVSTTAQGAIRLGGKVLAGHPALLPRFREGGEAGRGADADGEDGAAFANSVVRMGLGWRACPSSRRRFELHWQRICQNSCPQAA